MPELSSRSRAIPTSTASMLLNTSSSWSGEGVESLGVILKLLRSIFDHHEERLGAYKSQVLPTEPPAPRPQVRPSTAPRRNELIPRKRRLPDRLVAGRVRRAHDVPYPIVDHQSEARDDQYPDGSVELVEVRREFLPMLAELHPGIGKREAPQVRAR